MAEELADRLARRAASTSGSCTATWGGSERTGRPRVVALGGGHGLHATLPRCAGVTDA